jgi:DNA uptake protein ComE-like DNA-binding protein
LLSLGFAPWQVRNIYRYRAKGGVFRTPEDVAHIYGVTKEQYETLRPYIRISDDYQLAAHYVAPSERYVKTPRDSVKYPVKVAPNEKIVLNTADTTQLKRVPGIGSGWARRIFNYGKLLGGYVDIAQLTEIEGFPDEALSYFVIDHPHPQKMNLNKLTLNQLRRHPYINFYQARAICDYRRLKGPLQSLGQLRLLNDFTPTAIERLQPYVEF